MSTEFFPYPRRLTLRETVALLVQVKQLGVLGALEECPVAYSPNMNEQGWRARLCSCRGVSNRELLATRRFTEGMSLI